MQSFFENLDFSNKPSTCGSRNRLTKSHVDKRMKLLNKVQEERNESPDKNDPEYHSPQHRNGTSAIQKKKHDALLGISNKISTLYEKYPVLVNRYKCYDEIKKSVDELYPYLRDNNKVLKDINTTVEKRKAQIKIHESIELEAILKTLVNEELDYDEGKLNTFKNAVRKLLAQNGKKNVNPRDRNYSMKPEINQEADYHKFLDKIRSEVETLLPNREIQLKKQKKEDEKDNNRKKTKEENYIKKHYKSLGALDKKRDENFQKIMKFYEKLPTYVESDGIHKELQELAKTSVRPETMKAEDIDKMHINNYTMQKVSTLNENVFGTYNTVMTELEEDKNRLAKFKKILMKKKQFNRFRTENYQFVEVPTDILTLGDIEKFHDREEPFKKSEDIVQDVQMFLTCQIEEANKQDAGGIEQESEMSPTKHNSSKTENQKLAIAKSETHIQTKEFLDQMARQNARRKQKNAETLMKLSEKEERMAARHEKFEQLNKRILKIANIEDKRVVLEKDFKNIGI